MTVRACSKCKVEQPVSVFQHVKGRPSGQCRSCKTNGMSSWRLMNGIAVRPRSQILDGQKLCMECRCLKPLADYSPSSRGLGGVSAYCKPCTILRFKPEASEVRERTAAYRKRHPARWRASHRLHQFKRRSAVEATDDGTVTDVFLEALYATERCFYCKELTPREKRTADHKIPLSRGGPHSAANLVMACNPCNSSKSDMTDEEFLGVTA